MSLYNINLFYIFTTIFPITVNVNYSLDEKTFERNATTTAPPLQVYSIPLSLKRKYFLHHMWKIL